MADDGGRDGSQVWNENCADFYSALVPRYLVLVWLDGMWIDANLLFSYSRRVGGFRTGLGSVSRQCWEGRWGALIIRYIHYPSLPDTQCME